MGTDAAPAADALAAAMEDPDEAVRSKAAEALVAQGGQALPQLTAKLKSPQAEVRKLAIYSLIALGAAAKPAESAVSECLQDADPQVKELAELAIRRLRSL
jgi:HEAT repeat protein